MTSSTGIGRVNRYSPAWSGVDTRPAAVKNFLAYSLTRLGVGDAGDQVAVRLLAGFLAQFR